MTEYPQTLMDAVAYFSSEDVAVAYAARHRWPDGVACHHCGCKKVGYVKTRRLWNCRNKECRMQFTVKTGSVMEDSPLPVGKWMVVMWLVANAKNSVSSCELSRALGVTQKSTWFMLHRVHFAMQEPDAGKLMGHVEVDETFIGGAARFMHRERRDRLFAGRQPKGVYGKSIVLGMLERPQNGGAHSKVKAMVVDNTKRKTLDPLVRDHVEPGSAVYSDASKSYRRLKDDYLHEFIDHAVAYAQGAVHTNGLENFWALFKRCIKGSHVNIEPFHTHRYLDGEAFRFNTRKMRDGDRHKRTVKGMAGKRLTWKKLTGEATEAGIG